MRSTVTLDEGLLRDVRKVTSARTKSKAVVIAIQDYLRRRKVVRIKLLKGKLHFDKTADELRHYER